MNLDDAESLAENSSSYANDQNAQTPDNNINSESLSQKSTEFDYTKNIDSQKLTKDFAHDELYNEILEKLDIKKKDNKQDSQKNFIKENFENLEKNQNKNNIEKSLSQDFDKIQKLVKAGLINSKQGQNLKKQVLKKAFDKLVQTEKIKRALLPQFSENRQIPKTVDSVQALEEFNKNSPDFFSSSGRQEVLDYLKSGGVSFGTDELNKISDLIRIVEKSAIDRYLQKAAHEKTLKSSNDNAKQRLTANAQKSGVSSNLSRTFTREQIGKMSGSEFNKYESSIMEALKKGLIK